VGVALLQEMKESVQISVSKIKGLDVIISFQTVCSKWKVMSNGSVQRFTALCRRDFRIPFARNRCQIYNKKFIVTTIAQ
jgi:hypothetical protein